MTIANHIEITIADPQYAELPERGEGAGPEGGLPNGHLQPWGGALQAGGGG